MKRARDLAGMFGLFGGGILIGGSLRWAPNEMFVPVLLGAGLSVVIGAVAYIVEAPQ